MAPLSEEGFRFAGPPPAGPGRASLLLLLGGVVMRADTRTLRDACRQHVNRINQALAAEDFDQALYLAFQYFRAQARNCGKRRPEDAAGFKRQAVERLTKIASEMHYGHPLDDFRFANPTVPGGDWQPGTPETTN